MRIPLAVAVIGLAALAVGGSDIGIAVAGAADGSSATPTTLPVDALVPGLGVGSGPALRSRLAAPPPTAAEVPVIGVTDDVADLSGLLQLAFPDDEEAERARLQERGFVVAAVREWRFPDGSSQEVQLVEFETAAGAELDLTAQQYAYDRDTTHFPTRLHYPRWEGAGYVSPAGGAAPHRAVFEARVGNVFLIDFTDSANPLDPERGAALTDRQVRRLLGR